MRFIHNQDKRIADWVSDKIENGQGFFKDYAAIGFENEHDNELVVGVVYTNYHPKISIEMSVAAVNKKIWAKRENLAIFFKYPFIHLGVRRVSALISARNEKTTKLVRNLGFHLEGIIRNGCADGGDLLLFGMLKEECRYIKGNYDG